MFTAFAIALAFFVSLGLGRWAMAAADRLRFVDRPGERKLQERPVPLLGGAAIYLATLSAVLLLLLRGGGVDPGDPLLRWLLAGLWLLLVGLVDDRHGLGPRIRMLAQLLAALLFWPELASWLTPGWLGISLGLFWIVGLVNSLNFLDNMDGIAGSTGFWTALLLALALSLAGEGAIARGLWPLAAALLGYLWWNRPPARLYMGDAGSTFLGLTLAVFPLILVARGQLDPWLAPLLLALPIYDTCSVVWIRLREGRPIWIGDRRHVTHRMVARGRSVGRTLVVLNGWTLALGALALLWWWEAAWVAPVLALVAGVLILRWELMKEKS
jgi:UDP-GlcNAc:undecaprenyl-phosphate/decaprenyl-phosphate GlcNAc-1-phosphate transferase